MVLLARLVRPAKKVIHEVGRGDPTRSRTEDIIDNGAFEQVDEQQAAEPGGITYGHTG